MRSRPVAVSAYVSLCSYPMAVTVYNWITWVRSYHAHSPPLSGRGYHALTWRSHGHSLAPYLWRHLRQTVLLPGKCTVWRALTASVCSLAYLKNNKPTLQKIFCTCYRGRGSVLPWSKWKSLFIRIKSGSVKRNKHLTELLANIYI